MAEQWESKDKTILITGAASGLGSWYAERFLQEKAKRVIILDVDITKGYKLTERLYKTYSGKATFYSCDVSDKNQVSQVFKEVVAKFGQVDVIINNAGIVGETEKTWQKSCEVNWQGVVSFTLKGVKHMRKDEGGSGGTIINVSSMAALIRIPFVPVYSGTKAAVLHFTQCMAMDPFYERTGIRMMTFCIGATDTNILNDVLNEICDELKEIYIASRAESYNQKPQFAADALMKMYKEGANRSVWISDNDKPGKDITTDIDAAFKILEQALT